MKFLVLALCVCAANAAGFGSSSFGGYQPYKPISPASAAYQAAKTVAAPFQIAASAVASAAGPVADPIAQVAAPTYQAAQQVTRNVYNKDAEAEILHSESDISPNGYHYFYKTSNDIKAKATGSYKQVGDAAVVVVEGAYKYVSPDGTPVVISYIADENGYQPQGDILPVGPAIPEAIARSIAYNAAHQDSAKKY